MRKNNLGLLLDGRWEIKELAHTTDSGHNYYKLVNIYNGNEIVLSDTQIWRIKNGNGSVSKCMLKRRKILNKWSKGHQ